MAGKQHVTATTVTQATMEELLQMVFSTGPTQGYKMRASKGNFFTLQATCRSHTKS
jgi:hypothetical protein